MYVDYDISLTAHLKQFSPEMWGFVLDTVVQLQNQNCAFLLCEWAPMTILVAHLLVFKFQYCIFLVVKRTMEMGIM